MLYYFIIILFHPSTTIVFLPLKRTKALRAMYFVMTIGIAPEAGEI